MGLQAIGTNPIPTPCPDEDGVARFDRDPKATLGLLVSTFLLSFNSIDRVLELVFSSWAALAIYQDVRLELGLDSSEHPNNLS